MGLDTCHDIDQHDHTSTRNHSSYNCSRSLVHHVHCNNSHHKFDFFSNCDHCKAVDEDYVFDIACIDSDYDLTFDFDLAYFGLTEACYPTLVTVSFYIKQLC